jgi:hypothetical protein
MAFLIKNTEGSIFCKTQLFSKNTIISGNYVFFLHTSPTNSVIS